jgi:hypothetical protein
MENFSAISLDQGEEIKWIPGYEGKYAATNMGRIFSFKRDQPKQLCYGLNNGYYVVYLYKERRRKLIKVHRLIAIAFINNPCALNFINHKDGIKVHNHVSNLEWCTGKQNAIHAHEIGLYPRASCRKNAKFSDQDIVDIRASNKSLADLSKIYRVSRGTISKVSTGIQWKYIDGKRKKRDISKINMEIANSIRSLYLTGKFTHKSLGEKFNISSSNVCDVLHNKIWKQEGLINDKFLD